MLLWEKLTKLTTVSQVKQKTHREVIQINKTKDGKKEITIDTKEIQKTTGCILKVSHQKRELKITGEISSHILPTKVNSRWNTLFKQAHSPSEIKTVIKNIPINKSSGPCGFRSELYQFFKVELTPILTSQIALQNRN